MNATENTEWNTTGETLIKNVPPELPPTIVKGIYGLRCKTTDKWYIGQSINILYRWSQYKNLECKGQIKLYNALVKYGYEDFEKTIIEVCEVDSILTEKENNWMRFYNSIKNGYNIREAGSKGKHSEETKIKMSISQKGRIVPDDRRAKISATLRGRKWTEEQRNNITLAKRNMSVEDKLQASYSQSMAQKGRTLSKETRLKISQSNIGKKRGKLSDSTRIKMSISHIGKKKSDETRKRMSEASKIREEAKRLIRCNILTSKPTTTKYLRPITGL